jgi:hypothetical protein
MRRERVPLSVKRAGGVCLLVAAVLGAMCGCGGESAKVARPRDATATVGRGRTFAGTSFVATVQRSTDCPLSVTIQEGGSFGSRSLCYSILERPVRPKVECLLGLLAIHMQVMSAARSVWLTMSDGQRIRSPVMVLPRRLGGPATLYYQAVRPNPIPVALTELDASNRPLQTVPVPRVGECSTHLVKPVPGGTRLLVTVRAPGDRSLSIISQENLIRGKISRGLRVVLNGAAGAVIGSGALRFLPPLGWEAARICGAKALTAIYGVLEMESDRVFVRTGQKLNALDHIAIPASVGWHGTLVYGFTTQVPTDLIVRTQVGKTIVDERVGASIDRIPCV